jgi:hypothetical protein
MPSKILVCIALFGLALFGCTQQERLTPVRGTLFIGDKPSDKGMGYITFHPDADKGNKWQEEAVGMVKPDGTYELEARGKKGAANGWYKVGVSVAEVIDPNNPYVTNWLIPNPEKYQNWAKSGISIEVVEKPQPGQYDIKRSPDPVVSRSPDRDTSPTAGLLPAVKRHRGALLIVAPFHRR